MTTLVASDFPRLKLLSRGKVRDIYDFGDSLLLVASDRISAFDVVLPTPIPDKGRVLTQLSLFWFEHLSAVAPNHLLTADAQRYPAEAQSYAEQLRGRSMLVRRLEMAPIECVVRGYLAGSGWQEYRKQGTVCGIALPPGLREADRLPQPLFTPSTKATSGHDENISPARAAELVGTETARELERLSLELYTRAAAHAELHGLILADTKFEFGRRPGQPELVLGDEVLTPDSSRFWPQAEYRSGQSPPSFDKQYVRDYLETLHWNKQPPGPALPREVAERTREKYREAYRRLAGRELPAE